MSYVALYRKFRPATFDDVKGQDHIVTTLRNQINAGRIGHAYLFCGTRGTGKTSVAKIVGKAVNCLNPVNGSPCGECAMCKAIDDGSALNVIEIDAASNNGVDNVRLIREEVTYAPPEGNYKVYIIDEAHMLSPAAFNALLKTLEEPPSYVMFILATTETHKIPVTIMSRCQRYDFHRITSETIADRMKDLIAREGADAEDKAVDYIARQADGSMRDALSLLDQCLSFYMNETLTYEHVLDILGTVDVGIYREMTEDIINEDVSALLMRFDDVVSSGRDLGEFVSEFVGYLRNIMLLKSEADVSRIIDISEENLSKAFELTGQLSLEQVVGYIRSLSQLSNDMRFASNQRILVEAALIKLCRPQMDSSYEGLLTRVESLEKKIEEGALVYITKQSRAVSPNTSAALPLPQIKPAAQSVETPAADSEIAPSANSNNTEKKSVKEQIEDIKKDLPPAMAEDLKQITDNAQALIGRFPHPICDYLFSAKVGAAGDVLQFAATDPSMYATLSLPESIEKIEKTVAEFLNKTAKVQIIDLSKDKKDNNSYIKIQELINAPIEVDENL